MSHADCTHRSSRRLVGLRRQRTTIFVTPVVARSVLATPVLRRSLSAAPVFEQSVSPTPTRAANASFARRGSWPTLLIHALLASIALLLVTASGDHSAHASAPHALPSDLVDVDARDHQTLYTAAPLPTTTVDSLRSTFEEILTSPSIRGHVLGAKVVALSSDQVVYEKNADTWLKPASNTKVITTAAAFGILGESWRPASRVLSTVDVSEGTVSDDVVLHGVHDLSWSDRFYPAAAYPAERLVQRLQDRGVKRIDGDVIIHGLFVVYGYHFGTLDTGVERTQAAEVFRKALINGGIRVSGEIKVSHEPLPNGYSVELARWEGPALAPIADEINRASHNEFADMLLLAIAQADGGSASYARGGQAIASWLSREGHNTDGLQLHDGSGLSHSNRISAQLLTDVIAAVQGASWATQWNDSLSPAGVDGTYVNRLLTGVTRGRAWMKSGTINGVITGSGLLYHPATGEKYAVSLLLNDVHNQPSARIVLDKMVKALATTAHATERPNTPSLQAARLYGDGQVQLRWQRAAKADRYLIETRDETSNWTQAIIAQRNATDALLPRGAAPRAYRIRAINDGGISEPSRVLIAGGPKSAGRVVLIDGNERWLAEPREQKNALNRPHGFLTRYLAPLTGYRVESMTNRALLKQSIGAQDTVLFALGREANDTQALSRAERSWIEAHLRKGGRVIVSGAEVGWDLQTHANDGPDYMERVFGAAFIADSADDTVGCITPETANQTRTEPLCGHFWSRGHMQIKWPDAITATSGSSCMRYGNTRNDACVYKDNAVLVGFPLESIHSQSDRTGVIRTLLHLVGTPEGREKS